MLAQGQQCHAAAASAFRARRVRGRAAAGRRAHLEVGASGAALLEVKDLHARVAGTDKEILKGLSISIKEGEIHAIMGKNGSGKSTLSKVLVGHPAYEVTSGALTQQRRCSPRLCVLGGAKVNQSHHRRKCAGTATFKGKNLFDLEPEERSHLGMFLSFQSPVEVPGVRRAAIDWHVRLVRKQRAD